MGDSGGRPAVIVGAGIAGLTTALALARRGLGSVILERAPVLSEVGAGIQLSPNASGILQSLGLGPALDRVGVRPEAIVLRDAAGEGRTIVRLPLGTAVEARHGAPYLVVHRADLQAALLEAVQREPLVRLHLGSTLEAVEDTGDGVVVRAWCGAAEHRIEGSLVVGADGIWSAVRVKVLGGPGGRYSGRTAWRATLPASAVPSGFEMNRTTGLWLGPRAHLVHYPIRAGREVNVVACVDDDWIDERWDVVGDPADLARAFRGWPPAIRDGLLAAPTTWRKWALCMVPPQTVWTRGSIALIGDAAHAMLPFAAQGGAMAIEDAAVLARHVASAGKPMADRLAAYAAERRPRTSAVVDTARRNATVYHLSGLAAGARNIALRVLGSGGMMRQMDWIWGWKDPG